MKPVKWAEHAASGYIVSEDGRVARASGRDQETGESMREPVHVSVCNNGQSRTVAFKDTDTARWRALTLPVMMLEAHVGRPSSEARAHLVDGDPEHMTLDNLEWREPDPESKKRAKAGLTVVIRGDLADDVRTLSEIRGVTCAAVVRDAVDKYMIGKSQ